MSFFALLARASRGRSKLFVSLQLGLQIRMSLPAWRPMEPLFLSTGRLLYIIWKLGPLITSLCWAIHQSATTTTRAPPAAVKKRTKLNNNLYDSQIKITIKSYWRLTTCSYYFILFSFKHDLDICLWAWWRFQLVVEACHSLVASWRMSREKRRRQVLRDWHVTYRGSDLDANNKNDCRQQDSHFARHRLVTDLPSVKFGAVRWAHQTLFQRETFLHCGICGWRMETIRGIMLGQ